MNLRLLRPLLGLLLLCYLAGCRSEQAAFHSPSPANPLRYAVAAPDSVRPTVAPAPVTAAPTSVPAPTPHQSTGKALQRPLPRTPRLRTQHNVARHNARQHRALHQRHPHDETEGNGWLIALGVLLVAAGIAAGIAVGGGLGVFVGLVIGLVGYYFFTKGLLGPHAWLEVVQELFQM